MSKQLCSISFSANTTPVPRTDRRTGGIHATALPDPFVTPVTSCRRQLIDEVGCGCQRTTVLSRSNIQVCVCLHPPPTTTTITTATYPHFSPPSICTVSFPAHWDCMTLTEGLRCTEFWQCEQKQKNQLYLFIMQSAHKSTFECEYVRVHQN